MSIYSATASNMMTNHSCAKRKQDVEQTIPIWKRPRLSSATSSASAYASDLEDQIGSSIGTPTTLATPTTPSGKSYIRPKIYCCPYDGCGKAFNRPVRLEEHERSHTNTRLFKCPHAPCENDFLRQSHLNHHVKSSHTNERAYICNWEGCKRDFTTGTRLRRHLEAHEGQERYRCTAYPPCVQTFRKHTTLQSHINVQHLDLKAFPCTKCDSGFDTAYRLRAHDINSHGEQRYRCSLCSSGVENESQPDQAQHSKGFTSYSELQNHIQLEHPPTCSYCSLVCSTLRELERHIDIHHSGILLEDRRTFLCPQLGCGKGFTKSGNLNIHVRTVHQRQKNFICGEIDLSESNDLSNWDGTNACGRAFGAKASLEAHVRRQHFEGSGPSTRNAVKKASHDIISQKPKPSTFARLTGVGYAEESGREIACVIPACPFLFVRQYDLEIHARTSHGMLDADLVEALAEREALTGGKFWIGGDDDEDETWRYDEQDITKPNNELEFIDPMSMAHQHSQGPTKPMHQPRHPVEQCATPRWESPANFETLDFQSLDNFCAPVRSIEDHQQSLIDPLLHATELDKVC